ncbi:MAG: phenylalanine--tRNA ligase subunit beta [Aquificota bacterium]|nr:phenylalanine--tRNA ligase subunit beta [Aquificota bacterium]
MRVPLSWIGEFVDITGRDPEEIAEILSLRSVEASLNTFGPHVEGVYLGKVVKVEDHPERNDLAVVLLDLGGRGKVRAVTSDRGLKEGVRVPVAPPGARVKGKVVEKRPFGSVISEGFILSPGELDLEDGEGGVLKIYEDLEPGTDIRGVLGFGEPVLELDITPNRGDMLSVRGVARDLSALLNLPKKTREIPDYGDHGDLTIEILDQDCHRYRGVVVEGVRVGTSPLWVRKRLWQAGIRTINNVVDVTNYIMIQEGQPLHAFDLDKIKGCVKVRSAREGERIRTLEGSEVALDEGILVIADEEKPIAVAGIIGGEETAVTGSTDAVLLESAYFSPERVRRGSKTLRIQTESSYRFERNVDIEWLDRAQNLAVGMILKLAGGEVRAVRDVYKRRYEPKRIFLQVGKFTRYSGSEFRPEEVSRILTSLEIPCEVKRCGVEALIPAHRSFDITRDVDLIEEIMRVMGYDSFAPEQIKLPSKAGPVEDPVRTVTDYLRARGLNEVINISYEEVDLYRLLRLPPPEVEILNPLVPSQRFLRSSLIPSLIRTALYNDSHYNHDIGVFEVGNVFFRDGEDLRVGILLKGNSSTFPEKEYDHIDLMVLVQGIARVLGSDITLDTSEVPFLHPQVQARVVMGEEEVGTLGRLHPSLEREIGLKGRVYLCELSLGKVLKGKRKRVYEGVSRFPPVIRDLALLVDKSLSVSKLLNEIRSHMGGMVEEVMVFDLYTGEKVGEGKKSVGVRIVFRSRDRSLSGEEIGSAVEKLIGRLRERFGVEIR